MTNANLRFSETGYFADVEFKRENICSYMQAISVPDLTVTRCIIDETGDYEAARWNVTLRENPGFSRRHGNLPTDDLVKAIHELWMLYVALRFRDLRFYELDYENSDTVGLALRHGKNVFTCKNFDDELQVDFSLDPELWRQYRTTFDMVLGIVSIAIGKL